MQNSYSFVIDLCNPGFSAKFKVADGTLWEIKEYWTFLDNSNGDLVENLGHIIIIRQRNHRDRAYIKDFEAYPLEQTAYTVIQKTINDFSYWFSITFREYFEHFRPEGTGSFQRILCKLTFTLSSTQVEPMCMDPTALRPRNYSMKKRYDYASLQNIPSTDVKTITISTLVAFFLDAKRTGNEEKMKEAVDYIKKNYTDVKITELWREFSVNYPEFKDEILDRIIEDMNSESDRVSKVLQESVSLWSLTE